MIPDTKEALEAAGYVFDNEAYCRGCQAQIEWWISPNGRKMPMSVVEVKKEQGFFSPLVGYKRVPHWSNCPNAQDFRNREKSAERR